MKPDEALDKTMNALIFIEVDVTHLKNAIWNLKQNYKNVDFPTMKKYQESIIARINDLIEQLKIIKAILEAIQW